MRVRFLTNGVFLVALGLLILLVSAGVVDGGIWFRLLTLWPVLLVIWGIQIIFRKGPLALLAPLVLILTIIYAATLTQPLGRNLYAVDLGATPVTASEGGVEIRMGYADLRVAADLGLPAGVLTSGSSRTQPERPTWTQRDGEGRTVFTLASQDHSFVTWGGYTENRVLLGLNPEVPWSIDIKMGVVMGDLDLSQVPMESVRIQAGVGSTQITLGQDPPSWIQIDQAVGRVKIIAPKEIGVRITADGFLQSVRWEGSSLVKVGGAQYTSPNYSTAEARVDLALTGAIIQTELIHR